MHVMVNDIVAVFETNRQETLEATLATCRSLIKDIQQMESEQDTMKYQIEMYTHKVRQAHDEVFKKNTAKK
ncbi:hypothetical protein BCR42DRAFT_404227 [Absidia repens]|uniref:Uncharacterized protein n=1 Tax=Absidia repens TaxID=90262 RepID=A0A1X2IVV0_9FUNG|nr:hypothetical protein BCR42DRAFT_404227 [Absidia repens]